MQLFLKKDLPHQKVPIDRLSSIFRHSRISMPTKSIKNPKLDTTDDILYQNITTLQAELPATMKKVVKPQADKPLNIDVKMETGTGKTYVYTRSIYELNKNYGFKKFIIAVPSLPIKAGTENFIKNPDNVNHFMNKCNYNSKIRLHTIEGIKHKKGSKNYVPNAIREFVTSPNIQKNTIEVLLVNMHHLKDTKNGVLVRKDYDSHIEGYYKPIDAIAATDPILIIDEPHRFNREKATYKFIEEYINPQVIIRYGATFPEKEMGRGGNKIKINDYLNVIYDLNIQKAFQENLIKGIAKEHVESPANTEEVFKIMGFKKGESVRFQKTTTDENGKIKKIPKELRINDSLNLLSPSLAGITIEGILSSKVLLSTGDEKFLGDVFFADLFATSYVRQSIQLALKRHFEAERINLSRKFKIKTLALFFIDDIYSYRSNDVKTPYLKEIFEEELEKKLRHEIETCDQSEAAYRNYLEKSLNNIEKTHYGYFSQDNISSEEEIEKQVNTILRDKEALLSFNGDTGVTRFIFSKWTLKEGWDNPNIFTIAKLRSSGSDNSKLQEVGRGLRLPVDESGNRIQNESFTLNYIVDFTEKDFVNKLEREIFGETRDEIKDISSEQVEFLANTRNITKEQVISDLMSKGYISYQWDIKQENMESFIKDYPEIFNKLGKDKLKDRNVEKDKKVSIRKGNYWKLKDLWEKLNQKYYLYFEHIQDEVLINIVSKVIIDDLLSKTKRKTQRETMEMVQGELQFTFSNDSIEETKDSILNYGDFLKRLAKNTNLSISNLHKGITNASKQEIIEPTLFTSDTVRSFAIYFNQRIYDELLKVFSYKKLLNTQIHPTQLTDENGNPRDYVKTSAYIGTKSTNGTPLPNYLYDTIMYDSKIEKENIEQNHSQVEVFGKIPKSTIQIPFIDGSTYTPDFMYVINDFKGNLKLNAVIESKGVDSNQDLRGIEKDKIYSAKKLFELLKEDGVNVSYYKQTDNESILEILNNLITN